MVKRIETRDIIIAKKPMGGFLLGVAVTVIALIAIGAGSAIFYAGNQRIANVATPTASSDAATKAYVDSAVPPTSNMTVFTANGTWTRPAGVNKVWVTMVAGGGGGGHLYAQYNAGGGGGGQSLIKYPYAVSADVTVVVGKGGVAATGSGVGGTGGTTSFGTLSVLGGKGGSGNGNSPAGVSGAGTPVDTPCAGDGLGAGGGGGGDGGNSIAYPGGACGAYAGGTSGTTGNDGGGGGASSLGPGGNGGVSGVGSAGGTGGGGGGAGNGGGGAGGAGGDGKVIVEW